MWETRLISGWGYRFQGGMEMQNVRVYEMPDCKMVSSGIGMFGEEKFEV